MIARRIWRTEAENTPSPDPPANGGLRELIDVQQVRFEWVFSCYDTFSENAADQTVTDSPKG